MESLRESPYLPQHCVELVRWSIETFRYLLAGNAVRMRIRLYFHVPIFPPSSAYLYFLLLVHEQQDAALRDVNEQLSKRRRTLRARMVSRQCHVNNIAINE